MDGCCPPNETPTATTVLPKECPKCPRVNQAEAHAAVEAQLKRGGSVVDAATSVAEKIGAKPEAVRKAYGREKERLILTGDASDAMQFATMALITLGKIRKDDARRGEAFSTVINWIKQQGVL